MYRSLLLLCVAVSSYVRKGVNAAAAVRFDSVVLILGTAPSPSFYGNGLVACCKSINQHAIASCSRFLEGFHQCPSDLIDIKTWECTWISHGSDVHEVPQWNSDGRR